MNYSQNQNENKAPKKLNNTQVSLRIPRHISQFCSKINLEGNYNKAENILKKFVSKADHDVIFKEIVDYFEWEPISKIFQKEVKYEELCEKLEKGYEFKMKDFIDEETSCRTEDVNNSHFEGNLIKREEIIVDTSSLHFLHGNNSNFSAFNNTLKQGIVYFLNLYLLENENLFPIHKPIPVNNSQENASRYGYEGFLNNSMKCTIGYGQNSQEMPMVIYILFIFI